MDRSLPINDAIFVVGEDHEDQDTQPASGKNPTPENISIGHLVASPSKSAGKISLASSFSVPSLGHIAQTVKKMGLRTKLAQFSENLVAMLSNRWMDLRVDTPAEEEEEEYGINLDDTNKPWHEILADLEREMDPFSKYI